MLRNISKEYEQFNKLSKTKTQLKEAGLIIMEYPFDIKGKQNHEYNTESTHTFVCTVYFVALTILAAFSSTAAAKSLFTAVLSLVFEITKSVTFS